MTVLEFMKKVDGPGFQTEGTVDNFKYGDTDREVKKVVTCLTATVDVLKAAKEWGADLLITHEPTYYTHVDFIDEYPLVKMKEALVKECDIPICRFHDHMHFGRDDMISLGFLKYIGWKGTFDGDVEFILDEPKSPLEIAKEIEEKMDVRHVRIVGAREGKVTKIGLFLGHRGDECWGKLSKSDKYELALGGEWCEWCDGEKIRDAAQFGQQKTALMLGHCASERYGMKYLAELINEEYASEGIEALYIESGELFTYTD
ncbi:MAG: hypothetical protein E7660_00460 [Ruminococcaceae bacterium]|nr:hypothetical protein [Oscillospiraceae bacterium]